MCQREMLICMRISQLWTIMIYLDWNKNLNLNLNHTHHHLSIQTHWDWPVWCTCIPVWHAHTLINTKTDQGWTSTVYLPHINTDTHWGQPVCHSCVTHTSTATKRHLGVSWHGLPVRHTSSIQRPCTVLFWKSEKINCHSSLTWHTGLSGWWWCCSWRHRWRTPPTPAPWPAHTSWPQASLGGRVYLQWRWNYYYYSSLLYSATLCSWALTAEKLHLIPNERLYPFCSAYF